MLGQTFSQFLADANTGHGALCTSIACLVQLLVQGSNSHVCEQPHCMLYFTLLFCLQPTSIMQCKHSLKSSISTNLSYGILGKVSGIRTDPSSILTRLGLMSASLVYLSLVTVLGCLCLLSYPLV